MFLQRRGINSYIAFRNYGEHGGYANPEHAHAGLAAITHRADVLMSKLHFLPDYAGSKKSIFLKTRLYAKIRGWGRLLLLRVLEKPTLIHSRQRWRLINYAVSRLLSIY